MNHIRLTKIEYIREDRQEEDRRKIDTKRETEINREGDRVQSNRHIGTVKERMKGEKKRDRQTERDLQI